MLKLNSIPTNVFLADDIQDTELKTNSSSISRKDIVSTGRLVACEYFGRKLKGYEPKTNGLQDKDGKEISLADLDKAHKEKKLLFCATMANKAVGKEAPTSIKDIDASYAKDKTFVSTMAAIDKDVLDPLFFAILDDVGMGLMQWTPASLGSTTEIEIKSNDAFFFEDSSWGSGRSTSKNYLYAQSVFVTPEMYSCNATIKWYQDIVNGEAGRYYAAIMSGMWNKIYAILIANLKQAVSNGYIPAGLTAATYTTPNYITITDKVAAANGVRVDELVAIGTRSALSNLLPVDGQGGAIVGLQYGLGEKWTTNGFLPNVAGVDALAISPVIVPGTQNNELLTIDTGNDIFILAKGGYAPMRGVYAEGSPITLTATPSDTADFTIDINVGAMFKIVPLFASKVGKITSVYPNP